MSVIVVNADVTLRRQVEGLEIQCPDDVWPSRIAQIIQETLIGTDEAAIEFHSVSWTKHD
jgi:hypothetical protein